MVQTWWGLLGRVNNSTREDQGRSPNSSIRNCQSDTAWGKRLYLGQTGQWKNQEEQGGGSGRGPTRISPADRFNKERRGVSGSTGKGGSLVGTHQEQRAEDREKRVLENM